jgi:hypothetical protein
MPQVRQLQALGLATRKDIQAEVEVAAKFYRWAAGQAAMMAQSQCQSGL